MTRFYKNPWFQWGLAVALVHVLLLVPDAPSGYEPHKFLHLPVELALFLLLPFLPPRPLVPAVQFVASVLLAVLAAVKVANSVVLFGLNRPLDPMVDPVMAITALDTMARANVPLAVGAVAGVVTVVGGVLAALVWANRVLRRQAEAAPRAILLGAGALAVVATLLCFPTIGDSSRTVAEANNTLIALKEIKMMRESVNDAAAFDALAADDPAASIPGQQMLARLRGVDVMLIFIESYGRTVLETPDYAALIAPRLADMEKGLAAHGFAARSAWAASPTFGGESWLAHSTVLSGVWVNNQRRYLRLLLSGRHTLVTDFKRAGWHTVGVMPEITLDWPDADYFGYDAFYDMRDLGYRGEPFGYMVMPDQYTLSTFAARELERPSRPPLFAEIALISSHIPWAPIPEIVPWDAVGDGSIFTTARTPRTAEEVWSDPAAVPKYYVRTVDYVLRAVEGFITTYGRDNMLFIIMGDHQPMNFIAGEGASHDVPMHIVARNDALLAALGGDWSPGMTPDAASPVVPMDTVRARLVSAFTPMGRQE